MNTQSSSSYVKARIPAHSGERPSMQVPEFSGPRSMRSGLFCGAAVALSSMLICPALAQEQTKSLDRGTLSSSTPDIIGQPGNTGLLQRLSSWGVPMNENGLFADAVVDLGDGMTALLDADQFVEIIAADGTVLASGFAVFDQIDNDEVKGWLIDLDGNAVDFTITPRHGMGSTWGFLVQSEEAMGQLTVWFDYFVAQAQNQNPLLTGTPIVIPDVIPDIRPPRRGRRYCVCVYQLPDLTHTYAVKCSVMDCDLGGSCIHTEPGDGGQTFRGRCGWHEGDAGAFFPVLAGMTVGLASVCFAFRRRRNGR